MRLDRTRIAVLERTQVEILDLAFIVLREFFVPVMCYLAVFALPLAILNHWMIQWMTAGFIEQAPIWRYILVMCALVYVEAPFASILATTFLGKATFFEEPTPRDLLRDFFKISGRIFWTQLLLRGVLAVIVMVWCVPTNDTISGLEWLLAPICAGLFLMRSLRPYINEIVVLEKSPVWSRKKEQITVGKRSSRLHGPNSGDLFGRAIGILPVVVTLGSGIFSLLWFVVATFTNDWSFGPVIAYFVIPGTLWFLVAYLTVVRFLSYLDLRIRREGWEVELKMRAEANRMLDRISVGRSNA